MLVFPKTVFMRIVRDLTFVPIHPDEGRQQPEIKWRREALDALQLAAEQYLIDDFKRGDLLREHRTRETLSLKDMRVARRLYQRRWFRK